MQKTALVTGGNKGIGLETTRLLLELGFRVVVVARSFAPDQLGELPALVKKPYDLTDIEGIPQLVAEIGPVQVLINNAGVMHSLPYDAYPQEKLRGLMQLNIEAPVALIREVSKSMLAEGGGRIVNNASIAGQIGHPDVWYGIAKAGLINATKSFAKILGPGGIVINAVAPGPVDTDMLEVIPLPRREAIKSMVYSNRFARADEVARTMVWLATESPEYINGTCLDINNGAFPR
ncbi:SDR family NAD(P)-dependent oxidoreductase [Geomesophilobacter sediminis]|uniref:SDR family oxidoreductase n=1 Tax=Geomesophilobacter sediminis TaxID=2798584 RepID=A0A8J7LYW1_9BACT|nr:SDR family oxidoreductase [Geomesophilobacter sediminis]MBJ6725626.1 SDR family oxidoreductase [Geomesophilobacter sediminis]